jgi:hypothetical protein
VRPESSSNKKNGLTLIVPYASALRKESLKIPVLYEFPNWSSFKKAAEKGLAKKNNVQGIVLDYSDGALSLIPFEEAPSQKYPMIIRVGAIGDFRAVTENLDFLKEHATFVFPPDKPHYYRDAIILSSLGINSAVDLTMPGILWDELDAMVTWFNRRLEKNGALYPLSYLESQYNPREYLDMRTSLFQSPIHYLHADMEGNIYLTNKDLKENKPVGKGVDFVHQYPKSKLFSEIQNQWKSSFVSLNPCSTCMAFRICMGAFSSSEADLKRCKPIISKLFQSIDEKDHFNKKLQTAVKEKSCQPSS